ncbi:glycoside hydrolase family 19 protein [Gordonia sp. CPCC 205333]|uniref:glycoside hydrolase family 19 protein n=1 Tax=Gordonia sp. CPCC 205333 TaxID=3140790 RepID=UPI003AF3D3E8
MSSSRRWWTRRTAAIVLGLLIMGIVGLGVVAAVENHSPAQAGTVAPPPVLPDTPAIPISVWLLAGAAAILLTSPRAVRAFAIERIHRPGGRVGQVTERSAADYLTVEELKAIVPELTDDDAKATIEPLNRAMKDGEINTPLRQAAFLSQLAVESDRWRTTEEYANGDAYEGRGDLGNEWPGDGPRFKGRGYIQVTGRENYTQMSGDLGVDFVSDPELAADPKYAYPVSVWYWNSRGINSAADGGDIDLVSQLVNGGEYGKAHNIDERVAYFDRGKRVLCMQS